MQFNYRYMLSFASELKSDGGAPAILDFGCGAGAVVKAGWARGLNIFGTDTFYKGSAAQTEALKSGCYGTRIFEMRNGTIPFENSTFDLVLSNQVFEHVEDLDSVLREISRVLRPGGVLLSLFPSRQTIREGHIGIPFAHWFARGSKVRFAYTCALRCLGLGKFKQEAPNKRAWTQSKLQWLDSFTHYRNGEEICAAFSMHFVNEDLAHSYMVARAGPRSWLARLMKFSAFRALALYLFRRWCGVVILSRKSSSPQQQATANDELRIPEYAAK